MTFKELETNTMAEKGWKELSPGGLVCDAGSSVEYKTGTWRSSRPVVDRTKCNYCLRCWGYCPDGSVLVEDGRVVGVDLDYCKGCGLCVAACRSKAMNLRGFSNQQLLAEVMSLW